MDTYDHASAIMTNTYIDSLDSEDAYYLFSEGMEEKYGGDNTKSEIVSDMSGGDNEELSDDRVSSDSDLELDTDAQPTGGFPPIYDITRETKVETKTKSRELSTRTSAVSITDILKNKKVE